MDLQKLNERRAGLFSEHQKGKAVLAELGQKTEQTTRAMLQIEGGLAILDEMIAKAQPAEAAETKPVEETAQGAESPPAEAKPE